MPRKPPVFDLTTTCTGCGYKIPPRELMRVDGERIRCSKCGQDFVPEGIGTWSQLGGTKA